MKGEVRHVLEDGCSLVLVDPFGLTKAIVSLVGLEASKQLSFSGIDYTLPSGERRDDIGRRLNQDEFVTATLTGRRPAVQPRSFLHESNEHLRPEFWTRSQATLSVQLGEQFTAKMEAQSRDNDTIWLCFTGAALLLLQYHNRLVRQGKHFQNSAARVRKLDPIWKFYKPFGKEKF